MTRTSEERKKLLYRIFAILAKKGPKSTNMDQVASELGISKRTLYELFPSKSEMLMEIMGMISAEIDAKMAAVFSNAPNTLIGLYRSMAESNRFMVAINPDFFRDMEQMFPELAALKKDRDKRHRNNMLHIIRKGISEGVIRADLNHEVMLTMLSVQIAALKRSENLFPPEITFVEAANTVMRSFLRSIATVSGFEMLEAEDNNSSLDNNKLPNNKL